MIDPITFTAEHIMSIRGQSKRDPALIERSIFALGLLEAIARSKLPFIFKGGSALMLLLEKPRRFSTDIDVVVTPGVAIDGFLATASAIWPFVRITEDIRRVAANIEKRHFKFAFTSPLNGRELTILLDVLFEESPYSTTLDKSIRHGILLVKHPEIHVRLPNANCIISDKLTAFAPHTTGIPYNVDKELEIVKQLYDIASLAEYIDDFAEVKSNYVSIMRNEAKYRGLDVSPEDTLLDTIRTAICIAGRGAYKPDEYQLLKKGISSIRNHIYGENFNGEVAVQRACIVMYVAAAVLSNQDELPAFMDEDYYKMTDIQPDEYRKLNYIKNMDLFAYKHLVEAIKMIS
jgi:hypothetical protein